MSSWVNGAAPELIIRSELIYPRLDVCLEEGPLELPHMQK